MTSPTSSTTSIGSAAAVAGGNFAFAYTTLTLTLFFANNPRMQILTSFVNPDPRKFIFSTTVSF